jgi:hypothetical protein
MLVRLKKRGELPIHGKNLIGVTGVLSNFKGCIIEVEGPSDRGLFGCDGDIYVLTDRRFADVIQRGVMGLTAAFCSCCLIDDLDAYDSDSVDEQAEIGDLAFATAPVPAVVKS